MSTLSAYFRTLLHHTHDQHLLMRLINNFSRLFWWLFPQFSEFFMRNGFRPVTDYFQLFFWSLSSVQSKSNVRKKVDSVSGVFTVRFTIQWNFLKFFTKYCPNVIFSEHNTMEKSDESLDNSLSINTSELTEKRLLRELISNSQEFIANKELRALSETLKRIFYHGLYHTHVSKSTDDFISCSRVQWITTATQFQIVVISWIHNANKRRRERWVIPRFLSSSGLISYIRADYSISFSFFLGNSEHSESFWRSRFS